MHLDSAPTRSPTARRQFLYPGPLRLGLLALTLLCSIPAYSEDDQADPLGLSNQAVERDLMTRPTKYLERLTNDSKARRDYIEALFIRDNMEAALAERGLDDDEQLLQGLRNARERLVLDALVRDAINQKAADVEALAEERYQANPADYKIRQKIKLAVIFIGKGEGGEQEARTRIDEIHARLQTEPENTELFHDLARQYSQDVKADQGGVIDKWLIAPLDIEERDALMQAAFALDTVGDITEVVESSSGFAIGKLMALTPAQQVPFEAAKPQIMSQIQSELYEQARIEILSGFTPPEEGLTFDDDALLERVTEAHQMRKARLPTAATPSQPSAD